MRRAWLLLPLLALGACVTTTDRSASYDPVGAAQDNVRLGAHYLQLGDYQTAKDKLAKAEQQDPKNPEVFRVQAVLYELLNQPNEAGRNYQKAMTLAPNSAELVNTYAAFLCKQGQVDRALPMFEKVMADKLYPQPWVAATNAAVCLRGEKRNADAQRYLERAVALGPGYPDAIVGLADMQIEQGKPEAASETVRAFLAGGYKSPDVLLIGVRAAEKHRDCDQAQLYARMLRRDSPNSVQASALPQVLGFCAGSAN